MMRPNHYMLKEIWLGVGMVAFFVGTYLAIAGDHARVWGVLIVGGLALCISAPSYNLAQSVVEGGDKDNGAGSVD